MCVVASAMRALASYFTSRHLSHEYGILTALITGDERQSVLKNSCPCGSLRHGNIMGAWLGNVSEEEIVKQC